MYNKTKALQQKIFNKVAKHLLTQMEVSGIPDSCLYRDPNGLKCAVGCLIPDGEYKAEFENKAILNIPYLVEVVAKNDKEIIWLLRDLQIIHDHNDGPKEWVAELVQVANRYNLSIKAINDVFNS